MKNEKKFVSVFYLHYLHNSGKFSYTYFTDKFKLKYCDFPFELFKSLLAGFL